MSDKRYIPVRLSSLLHYCSVGAIVRGPEYAMVVRDTREWTVHVGKPAGRVIHYVEQVKSALKIERELREPPVASEGDKGIEGSCVPANIFPAFMRCLTCGTLHDKPWRDQAFPNRSFPITCQVCIKGFLEQVSWVLVHTDGHLAEVPWHYLTHKNATQPEQKNCRRNWNVPYLALNSRSGGLQLRCSICRAFAKFNPRNHLKFYDTIQPWLDVRADSSEELGEILELNDARLYFPCNRTALVIPPESRVRKGTIVDRLYSSSDKLKRLQKAKTGLQIKQVIKLICNEFQCTPKDIEEAVALIDDGYPLYDERFTSGLLLESEYKAFTEVIPDLADDEDFVPHHLTKDWHHLVNRLQADTKVAQIGQLVDTVISVARLKAIMVMTGFRRLSREGRLVPPDIVGGSDWLPALELFGEGLFFTLKEPFLQQWEQQASAKKRGDQFLMRYTASGFNFDPEIFVTPRFLLLHALAHMLIRELERQAGYPAADLHERIYCRDPSKAGEPFMAGILIYVAVPDVAGSLGGLAEQAQPKRLLSLLSRVFDHAEWCSLDPVCGEHEGQGPGLLNQAACHGCLLIPEICCPYGNVLLDRLFIKGDRNNGLLPILDFVSGAGDGKA